MRRRSRESGYALAVATFFVLVFLGCVLIAVQASLSESNASYDLGKRQIAFQGVDSAVTYGLAKIRRGGIQTLAVNAVPFGATGSAATWDLSISTQGNNVTIAARAIVSEVHAGVTQRSNVVMYKRARLLTGKFIPSGALYFGNAAVEKPRNNYEGAATDSYIANNLPFLFSAWNHPYNFITNPIATPPTSNARWRDQDPLSARFGQPFDVFESQTSFGKSDVTSFLAPFTSGSTFDPATKIEQMPGYDAYPTFANYPDVQTFAFDLWAQRDATRDLLLSASDVATGNYADNVSKTANARGLGTLQEPRVVFVTGELKNTTKPFRGAGILVIRDDWDPAVGGPRNVATKATLTFMKQFEWTGMVVIAGWAPQITTAGLTTVTNTAKINGTLMGEDSVQSGGELSLMQATIQFYIGSALNGSAARANLEVYYSKDAFDPANPIYDMLPEVQKTVVSMETAIGTKPDWAAAAGW